MVNFYISKRGKLLLIGLFSILFFILIANLVSSATETFGYSTIGTGAGSEGGRTCLVSTMGSEDGTAQNMSVYLSQSATSFTVKGALYSEDRTSLLGETEEIVVTNTEGQWINFTFDDPKPSLSANTNYSICFWSGVEVGSGGIYYYRTSGAQGTNYPESFSFESWLDWPADISGDSASSYVRSSYITYTTISSNYPQVQSVTETQFSSATISHNISMPASVNSGDLLIILFANHENFGQTTPSGWTELGEDTPGDFVEFGVYAKVADGTEGGTTVDVQTSAAQEGAAQVYRITNWSGNLATGVEISSPVHNTGSSNPDSSSLNPSNWDTEETLWITAFGAGDDDATVSNYPSGYSGGIDTVSGAGANAGAEVGSAYLENTSASEDPGAFTLSESEAWSAYTIAVRPLTSSQTEIGSCQVLSTANHVYYLNQSITGISEPCFNITADNITLDLMGFELNGTDNDNSIGVFIYDVENATVTNGSLNKFVWGIESNASYSTFYNLDFYDGFNTNYYAAGIVLEDAGEEDLVGINFTNLNFYNYEGLGILTLDNIYNSTYENIYSTGSLVGISFVGGYNLTFLNMDLIVNSDDGLGMKAVNNSIFTNVNITATADDSSDGALYIENSNNNLFYNLNITTNQSLAIGVYLNSNNNSFISSYFETGKEDVGDGEIFRKWYFDAQVTNSTGNLEDANVTIYNSDGEAVFSILTNSTGQISQQILTEYLTNETTRTFYTPNTINVSKTGYVTNSTEYNLSVYQNVNHFVLLEETPVDSTAPTFSNNQTNNTLVNLPTLFSLYVNDETALESNGQYIFSTNNSGEWVNDSAVNFTSTPEWANVSKVLNNTGGVAIGYRWYLTDNAGNSNNTEIYILTTIKTNIETCEDLQNIANDLTQNYSLENDIDCSDSINWDSGSGFNPIGSQSDSFTGIFEGNNYTISDLYINRENENYTALFSTVNGGIIKNVGLTGANISGSNHVGILVGQVADGVINNSYSTGLVSGSVVAGGLIGSAYSGEIYNSYSRANVSATSFVGGLIGDIWGTISNSYSTGLVSGDTDVGGLTGNNIGTVSNSYWDNETSGQSTSEGGTGKTTTEMKNAFTFSDAGWDIAGVGFNQNNSGFTWNIVDGFSYPFLGWQSGGVSEEILPTITFVSPTPNNNSYNDEPFVYLNATVSSDTDTSAWFDWNNSLVGYWGMDSYNSTGIYDQSPNSNFATFTGELDVGDILTGKRGFALNFSRGTDTYLDAGEILPANIYTKSAWIYMTEQTEGQEYNILSGDVESGGHAFWVPGSLSSSFCSDTGGTSWALRAGHNNDWCSVVSSSAVQLNTWTHVAVTYDSATTTMKLYFNGILEDTNTSMDAVSDPTSQIGGFFSSGNHAWKGNLDEVMIFNRVLSNSEIQALYNSSEYGLKGNFTGVGERTLYNYATYAIDEDGDLTTSTRNAGYSEIYFIAFGDSITYGYGLDDPTSERWSNLTSENLSLPLINVGQNSAKVSDEMQTYISNISNYHQNSTVVFMGGTNDINSKVSESIFKGNYTLLVQNAISYGYDNDSIYLTSVPWSNATGYTENISLYSGWVYDVSVDNSVNFINMTAFLEDHNEYLQADGIHPNVQGNIVIADVVSYYILNGELPPLPSDTTPPTFTSIPSNATLQYGNESLSVDFDATDETEFGTFSINWTQFFTINSTGWLSNSTILPVGIYEINVSINDSSGNENYTVYQVVVNQNSHDCSLFFNETSPTTYPGIFTVFTNCNSDFTIYRNGTATTNNSVQSISSGLWNFTVFRTDISNYSIIYDQEFFTINKGTPSLSVTGTTPIDNETTGDVEGTGCPSQLTCNLYRNSTLVSNPDASVLSVGSYGYVYNTSGNENYTSASDTFTLVVTAAAGGEENFTTNTGQPADSNTNLTYENNFTHLNVSDANLVLYMPFDVDSTGTVYDYTNNSNDGTLNGTISYTSSGYIDGGYSLDGDNDFIGIPQSESLNISGDAVTISAWFKLNDDSSTGMLVSKPVSDSSHPNPYFSYNLQVYSVLGNTYPRMWITTSDSVMGAYTNYSGDLLDTGAWYHAVGMYNGTDMCAYLDGSLLDCDPQSGDLLTYETHLRIGVNGELGEDLDGSIDEVMVWNRGLTPSEISDLYNNQSARFYPTGEMLFQNLNFGTNDTLNISIPGCEQLVSSQLSFKINDGSYSNLDSGCSYNEYSMSGDLTSANLTVKFSSDANQFYSPLVVGNISLGGYVGSGRDSTAPQVNIISPTEGQSFSSSTVSFSVVTDESSTCYYILNGSSASVLLTANGTGTGHTKSVTFSNGAYSATMNCSDSSGNVNNTEIVNFSVSVASSGTTSPGGSSSGTVSSTTTTSLGFTTSVDSINLDIGVGTTITQTISVTNTGTDILELDISETNLGHRVIVPIDSISLSPGEKRNIRFVFQGLNYTGIFAGKIHIGKKSIPVALNVKELNLLFDSNIVVLNNGYVVRQGDNLKTSVELIPQGDGARLDVMLNYEIKSYDGEIFLTRSESVLVEDRMKFERNFDTGILPPGEYVVALELIYPNGVAPSSAHFEIIPKIPETIIGKIAYYLVNAILILIIIMIGVVIKSLIKRLK